MDLSRELAQRACERLGRVGMSAGMWIVAGVMMGMMVIGMAGIGWGAIRRRLRRRDHGFDEGL